MATAAILTNPVASVLPCGLEHYQTPNRRLTRSLSTESDAENTTPALTPSSEVSELEIQSPATPATPTKSISSSRFLETCVPWKLERRILQTGEDAKEAKKPLWDVAFGDTSTKAWLFSQCSNLESWKKPDQIAISVNFEFSECTYGKPTPHPTTKLPSALAPVPVAAHASRPDIPATPGKMPLRAAAESRPSKHEKPLNGHFIRALPTDVVTRLIQNPDVCVAQTKKTPYRQCTKKRPLDSVQPDSLLADFKAHVETQDLESGLALVDRILPKLHCKSGQHQRIAKVALDTIKITLAEATAVEAPSVKALVLDWLKGLAENRPLVTDPATSRPRQNSSNTLERDSINPKPRRSGRIAAKAETAAAAISVNEIEPKTITYVPYYDVVVRNCSLTPSQLIHQTLDRPLLQSDLKDGYLYVFWRQGDFGLVKIGHTTVSRIKRLDGWRQQCGADNQGCGDVRDKSSDVRVRNVRRLESLVHAELKQYRRRQRGCRCDSEHVEWFAVDLALVYKVVEKWTSWLRERPRYKDEVGGRLLPLTEKERGELCKSVELTERVDVKSPADERRRSSRLRLIREKAEANLGENPWAALESVPVS